MIARTTSVSLPSSARPSSRSPNPSVIRLATGVEHQAGPDDLGTARLANAKGLDRRGVDLAQAEHDLDRRVPSPDAEGRRLLAAGDHPITRQVPRHHRRPTQGQRGSLGDDR